MLMRRSGAIAQAFQLWSIATCVHTFTNYFTTLAEILCQNAL